MDVHIPFVGVHADDAVIDSIDLDVFAAGVFSLLEERFIDAFAYDAHLARLTDIYIVDKASVPHILVLNVFVIRVEALD